MPSPKEVFSAIGAAMSLANEEAKAQRQEEEAPSSLQEAIADRFAALARRMAQEGSI